NTERPTPPVSMMTRSVAACSTVPRREEIMPPPYRPPGTSPMIDSLRRPEYCTGKYWYSRKSGPVDDHPSASPVRPRRLPLHQAGRRHDLDRLLVVPDRTLDPAEESLHDVLRHRVVARVDGGQPRHQIVALQVIVETH